MGIHNHSGYSKCVSEYDIGGLAPNSAESDERCKILWDLSLVQGKNLPGAENQVLCLVAEKACRTDQFFDLSLRGLRQLDRRGELFEQLLCDDIDPDIGTLGRKNGRNQQLPRVLVIERAMGIGIKIIQSPE